MKNILVTYAVKEEFEPVQIEGYHISYLITGVGKTRSAMKLTEAVLKNRPDLVINIGSSGTLSYNTGDIFVCQRFLDRDYMSTRLPGIDYEISSEEILRATPIVQNLKTCKALPGVCNTGDNFVTSASAIEGDVVDMEAFAQATVCREFGIPFLAVKYVTDIIGQNSVKHWEEKLTDARNGLGEFFQELLSQKIG